MEYWSIGILQARLTSALHHSTTPLIHYSISSDELDAQTFAGYRIAQRGRDRYRARYRARLQSRRRAGDQESSGFAREDRHQSFCRAIDTHTDQLRTVRAAPL